MNEYQEQAHSTLSDSLKNNQQLVQYLAMGLAGETGEVLEKMKKVFRDKGGKFDEETNLEIAKEIGDVLWYSSQLAHSLGYSFEEIAMLNIEKLKSRQERGKISGSGDNR